MTCLPTSIAAMHMAAPVACDIDIASNSHAYFSMNCNPVRTCNSHRQQIDSH